MFQGGCGIIREVKFLVPCQVNILSERRDITPFGLAGGKNGVPGRNIFMSDGQLKEIPSKIALKVKAGEKLTIETPGGGWGD